jgi:hypothetical protein
VARQKSREEKLFGAAVLRRSFELRAQGPEQAFRTVYQGVLRDLGLTDDEVVAFLSAEGNRERVEAAIGRRPPPGAGD